MQANFFGGLRIRFAINGFQIVTVARLAKKQLTTTTFK
jgi:hypothetical protein